MAAKQAILLNGVPICGRCYNAVRAAQQQQAAQAAPPSGFQVVSETATTQQLLTGPSAETRVIPNQTAPTQQAGGLPAPVPFSQAAVPIEQVFQPEAQAQEQPATDPQSPAPQATTRDSARRTAMVPPPPAHDKNRVYLVGGISAVASFFVVLLGYYVFAGSKTEPETKPGKNAPPTKQTYAPQLPTGTPSLPPSLEPTKKEGPVDGPPPATKPTAEALDREFEEIRRIPDEEKDRKAAALKAFLEKCDDQILLARARSLYSKLTGLSGEPPLQPTKAELKNKMEGLRASYFHGRELQAEQLITSQTDLLVSMNVKNPRPPGVPNAEFSARWQGYLYVEKEGLYTISTMSDDGVRVKLGDRRIIDNWGDHGAARDEKKLTLKPGYYKLAIEYYQGGSDGEISLSWALKDGFDERLVTADNLFHEGK